MANNYVVSVSGIKGLDDLLDLDQKIETAARRAVNYATNRARKLAADVMMEQIEFPTGYLAPGGGRLKIKKLATANDLEGIITGRDRPTSLARFSRGTPMRGRPPKGQSPQTTVVVKPGKARGMSGAFLIKLRAGNADIQTRSNLGLAIRLRGRPIHNKKIFLKEISKGLFLLYGPSVNQIFGGEKGVAERISPDVAKFMEDEFNRQMDKVLK